MTYKQALEFCKKDNATIPFIKNLYWFRTLTQYLEAEQEDWRYYDMVWVSDLDAQEGTCKVTKLLLFLIQYQTCLIEIDSKIIINRDNIPAIFL